MYIVTRRTHILSSDSQVPESVRTPAVAGWLKDVALRDLGLHEEHGACIDALGDVYQWGDGFFGTHGSGDATSSGKPVLTLRGKVCYSEICIHARQSVADILMVEHHKTATYRGQSVCVVGFWTYLRAVCSTG